MRPKNLIAAAVVVLLGTVGVVRAGPDITEFDINFNAQYTQTITGVSATPFYYFGSRVDQDAGAYNQGSFAYPGPGSPQAYTLTSGNTLFNFQTTPISTRAALDTAYPFGTYTASVTNTVSGATNTDTIQYTQTAYTSSVPALTPSTYSGLQGLNVTHPFTFNFNAQTPNPLANVSYTFLTLFGPNGTSFAIGSFLSPGTTSVVLPANTLLPNTQYSFDLDFSDRITGTSTTATNILFDVRTDGTFTTAAVPEPCGLALAGIGLAGAAVRSRRGRKFRQWISALIAPRQGQ
jgi:hypothetical protein